MKAKALRQYLNGKRVRAAFTSDRASNGSKLPPGKKRFEQKRFDAFVASKSAAIAQGRAR